MSKLKIPEDFLQALYRRCPNLAAIITSDVAQAFAAELAARPISPTQEQMDQLIESWRRAGTPTSHVWWIVDEWQRRMFLVPNPEVPVHVWSCTICKIRVQSAQDFHINDRLTCVQCNAEMKPYFPDPENDVPIAIADLVNCCRDGNKFEPSDVRQMVLESFRRAARLSSLGKLDKFDPTHSAAQLDVEDRFRS